MADYYETTEGKELLSGADPGEAVSDFLNGHDITFWPRVLHVFAYTRREFRKHEAEALAEGALESILEWLDEEYGGEDGTDPTNEMKAAALAFSNAVLKDYVPWQCEREPREDEWVPLAWWIRENEPSLLEVPEVQEWLATVEDATKKHL